FFLFFFFKASFPSIIFFLLIFSFILFSLALFFCYDSIYFFTLLPLEFYSSVTFIKSGLTSSNTFNEFIISFLLIVITCSLSIKTTKNLSKLIYGSFKLQLLYLAPFPY